MVQKEILGDSRLDGQLLTEFNLKVDRDGCREFDEINTGVLWEGWQKIAATRFPGRPVSTAPGIGYSDATVAQKKQECYSLYSECQLLMCTNVYKY